VEELKGLSRSVDSVNKKIDLQALKPVKGAEFDSYDNQHTKCLPGTQVKLLRGIK
jgi:hypothetical protein